MGTGVAIAAVAMGARVIEKHLTLRRADGGVDSAFSLEPLELKSLVVETERAFLALGRVKYGVLDDERKSLAFKRSIYVVSDLKAGDTLTETNLRVIRPGLGIAPRFYDMVLGKKIKTDVKRGTALTFDLLF
jgi:N-acetylneuraminate synthase